MAARKDEKDGTDGKATRRADRRTPHGAGPRSAGDAGARAPVTAGPAAPPLSGAKAGAVLAAACLGWLFSAMDILLVIFLQEPIARDLGISPDQMKLAIGMGLFGSAIGGVLFAQLGDRLGRTRALGLAVLLYSLSTGAMALVSGFGGLLAVRFIAGMGTGGEWSLGFALVTEVWRPRRRGLVGGLVAAMFNLGTFAAILLYQSELAWRLVFGMAMLPGLGVVAVRLWVPESAVWTRLKEARAAGELSPELQARVERPPLLEAFRGRLRSITLRGVLLFTLLNFAFYGFATIFFNYLQWSPERGGLGLARNQELVYQLLLNVASLVLSILAGALSDRLGRRNVFAACALLGAVGFALLLAVGQGHDPHLGPPPGLLAAFMVITAGYGMNGVVGPLLAELYPTYLRATGPGLVQNLGKGIGGMAGPIVGGLLIPRLGLVETVAAPGLLFAAAALLIFLLPAVDRREVAALEHEGYLTGK